MSKIIDISEILLELGLASADTDEERAIVNTAVTRAESAVIRHLKYDPVQRQRTEYYPQSDYDYQSRYVIWETQGVNAVARRRAEPATSELQVRHVPIRSVDSLFVDFNGRSGTASGAFGSDTEKTEGTDFWANYDSEDSSGNSICFDGILRSFGAWPISPGTVKVVYTAGYTAAELHGQDAIVDAGPIMDALIDEAARKAKKAFVNKKKTGVGFAAGPFLSETLGDYKYEIDTSLVNRLYGGINDLLPETKEKLNDFVNYGWPTGS